MKGLSQTKIKCGEVLQEQRDFTKIKNVNKVELKNDFKPTNNEKRDD